MRYEKKSHFIKKPANLHVRFIIKLKMLLIYFFIATYKDTVTMGYKPHIISLVL